jgi:hypothetical protein
MSTRSEVIKEVREFLSAECKAKFDALKQMNDVERAEGERWKVDGLNELIAKFETQFPVIKVWKWSYVYHSPGTDSLKAGISGEEYQSEEKLKQNMSLSVLQANPILVTEREL